MEAFNFTNHPVLDTPERVEVQTTNHYTGQEQTIMVLAGVWLRYSAGIDSLIDRADLRVKVVEIGAVEECSHYGDTDRKIKVIVGNPMEDFAFDRKDNFALGRVARFEGDLILHRTVGGRADWRLQGVVAVRSSQKDEITVFAYQCEDRIHFAERVVEELAATMIESSLATPL